MESGARDPELSKVISCAPMENNAENPERNSLTP